jgi:DNA-binding winged helix-turn-helix (wHTH) protein
LGSVGIMQNGSDRSVEYRFGAFMLDGRAGRLLRNGEEIPLRPKSMDVLRFLVEHPGQVISRERLLRAAWPAVVVSDDSVTQCLVEIRRALDDHDHTLVRTLPKRGYMLDVPVTSSSSRGGAPHLGAPDRRERFLSSRPPSRLTVVALVILAFCIAATWWRIGILP